MRNDVSLPGSLVSPAPSAEHQLTQAVQAAGANQPEDALAIAMDVREAVPWHRGACQLQLDMLRRQGRLGVAQKVYFDCLSYFPTRYLR